MYPPKKIFVGIHLNCIIGAIQMDTQKICVSVEIPNVINFQSDFSIIESNVFSVIHGQDYRQQFHAHLTRKFDYLQIKQYWYFFVCLILILYVPVNNFSVMSGRVFLGWTSTKQG